MERLLKEDYIHGGTQKNYYEEQEREFCHCPLCDADNYTKLDSDRGLSVVRCKECELIYTNPRAKNAEQNYFGETETYYNEARLIFKGKKPHHRDRNYVYELEKISAIKAKGKLLDVGTNMGFFLRKARDFGYEVEGIEPAPSLSEIARKNWKLKIHTSYLEAAGLPNNNYDIITLIDVFEHVTNPKALLAKCNDLLKDEGIIVIKVPNGDYNHFKMKLGRLLRKGSNMDIWDCCEHVVHYTPQTFRKMVSSCGLKTHSFFVPLPIHSPVWAHLVGHYYQYPSPFLLDWKRILLRNCFYYVGKIEKLFFKKLRFAPDLMFVVQKQKVA